MMRAHQSLRALLACRRLAPLVMAAFVALSCSENLPSGPNTFVAAIKIDVAHDTLVVGDSASATAVATDNDGRVIQGLSFAWGSADSAIVAFAAPASPSPEVSSGRSRTFIGRHSGRAAVTLTLPDSRFVTTSATRTQTVVVGGVRILTTHDSTLSAVNDTAVAIAAGLVRANGALVTRASQGVRWIHLGSHAAVVGQGDTIRYIARSNGADTLIATHDFCLIGAKCADTAIVHVSQQLTMTLSVHEIRSWSFSDSLGPTITLADRRGNGLAGTSIRLVPATAGDSVIVKPSAPFGVSDPQTGLMAAPRLISIGNGTARVAVLAIAPDGVSIVATDSITDIVRQVARRVAVEPLRALVTDIDSIPIRRVARDARGVPIADATVSITTAGIIVNGGRIGPNATTSSTTQGTITPTLTGVALPDSNPLAPQVPVVVNPAVITIGALDSVTAGATQRVVSVTVLDSNAVEAAGSWVRFGASGGVIPDSVQVDAGGVATVTWIPPNIAGPYTLTGLRSTSSATLVALPDSAGRIVIRRSVVVIAGSPAASRSTVAVSATSIATNGTATVTIVVKDQFGNVVTTAAPTDFNLTATRGTFGAVTCTLGTCTATYTAPATTGADSISVKILGVEILFSPITLTIS